MRTTRHLRDMLAAEFPSWHVTDDAREVTITKPTIVMAPREINRVNTAGRQISVQVVAEVWLLTEKLAPRGIEPELDNNIIKVLAAIEADPRFTWSQARRGALDTDHGWNLDVTFVIQAQPIGTP